MQVCTPDSITYPTSRTWANVVQLQKLRSATTYYYKIKSTNSSVEHFLSPRLPGDKTPFTMNAVIDLGVYGEDGFTIPDKSKRDMIPEINPSLNHTTIGRLATTVDDYELVIHPGDFAYADNWYLKAHNELSGKNAYEAIMEQFYGQLAPVAGRKPYMASPGNHDADCEEIRDLAKLCPEGQKNFTDFMLRFGNTMPTAFASTSANQSAQILANKARELAKPPFWYSFEYGMVHVTMLDTETDIDGAPDGPGGSADLDSGPFGGPGQQLAFLEADLASVDRTVTPWLLVAGHRPWYVTEKGPVCSQCQAQFEPLMYKYGVDLGVFGHVHNSQRTVPAYQGKADPAGTNNPKAPMYMIAGGAGNIEGLDKLGKDSALTAYANHDDFGYGTITFHDAQNMEIKFIRSATGDVVDRSTLYKEHSEAFPRQS